MSWLAAIIAALQSIPALSKLIDRFVNDWQTAAKAKREREALARKQSKDAAVDAAVDRVRDGPDAAGQQPKTDEPPGL